MIQNTIGVEIKIVPSDHPSGVDQVMRDAIAKKAFQLFENRGRIAGQEEEDWILAESKVVRPLCCGVLETEDAVDVAMDVSGFDLPSGIEIVTEPHRLIVSGVERLPNEPGQTESKGEFPSRIFSIVKLPVKVDASKIESDLKGHVLQIRVSKTAEPEPTYCGQVELMSA